MTTMPGMIVRANSVRYALRIEEQKCRCRKGPDDGAGVIHGAVKAVHPPAIVGVGEYRQHGISRRAADSLAQPIDEPQREHMGSSSSPHPETVA